MIPVERHIFSNNIVDINLTTKKKKQEDLLKQNVTVRVIYRCVCVAHSDQIYGITALNGWCFWV